jgi:DNA-binding transcriptional LysR family regulator
LADGCGCAGSFGPRVREHAARVRAEIDAALETILPAGELRGRLRIAAPLSLGPTHLAPVFADMALRHPLLHVQASYSDRLVDIIGDGFDCTIRVGYLSDSNLIARRVGATALLKNRVTGVAELVALSRALRLLRFEFKA